MLEVNAPETTKDPEIYAIDITSAELEQGKIHTPAEIQARMRELIDRIRAQCQSRKDAANCLETRADYLLKSLQLVQAINSELLLVESMGNQAKTLGEAGGLIGEDSAKKNISAALSELTKQLEDQLAADRATIEALMQGVRR